MRQEIRQKIAGLTPKQLQSHLLDYAENSSLKELNSLSKILNSVIDHNEKIKFGEVVVFKKYFYQVQNSGIFKHAYEIVDIAATKGPLGTKEILTIAGIKPITHKIKMEAGQLLTLAGFKRASVHRKNQTPVKLWKPIDKHIDSEYRAEYFFTLLKDHVKIADTKSEALDDLI
jgi:hypothetical protein